MTTRHLSVDGVYPFIGIDNEPAIEGIKDVYFVLQGDPTVAMDPNDTDTRVRLIQVQDLGSSTQYTFQAVRDTRRWIVTFIVPHNVGTGQVVNEPGPKTKAVLIFNSDQIYQGGGVLNVDIVVEPSRAQWHVSKVQSMSFYNICRENGVEDTSDLIPVLILTDPEPYGDPLVIPLEDGFNSEVTYDPDINELTILVDQGIGKGPCPDFGDTVCADGIAGSSGSSGGSSEEPIVPDQENVVSVINGLVPVDGNLDIQVSRSLSINTAVGLVEIIAKL